MSRWFWWKKSRKLEAPPEVGSQGEMAVYGDESRQALGGAVVVPLNGWNGGSRSPNPGSPGLSQSVSLSDIGLEIGQNGFVRAAAKRGGGGGYQLPLGTDPTGEADVPMSEKIAQFVINTSNQQIQPPPIEQVQVRQTRGQQAMQYFLNDGVASGATRSLYEFVIGPGFDIDVIYDYEAPPPWFNSEAPEVAPIKAKWAADQAAQQLASNAPPQFGGTPGAPPPDPTADPAGSSSAAFPPKAGAGTPSKKAGPGKKSIDRDLQIFRAYMQFRVDELKDKLDLETWAVEMAKDALVVGDSFSYRVDSIVDETYVGNIQPSAEFLTNSIEQLQGLNPLAILLTVDEFNEVTGATLRPQSPTGGAGSTPLDIPDLTKLIRMKWNGQSWSIYGVSHLAPALRELQLKASLIRAAQASADRYSVPIRLVKYGLMAPGDKGGPIAPDSWRDDIATSVSNLNPETSALVAPFHVTMELIGAEKDVVDLSPAIAECDRRTMMAVGIPPNFLDSNFTSFATAKIQFTNTILKLRQLQRVTASSIEGGILDPFANMRGYRAPDGSLIKLRVRWHRGELESDPAIIALIGILSAIPGQRLLSNKTMRDTMGFSSDQEEQNLAAEDAAASQRAASMGLPQPGAPGSAGGPTQIGPDGKPAPNTDPAGLQDPGIENSQPTVPKGKTPRGVNKNPTKVNQ